MTQGTHVLVVDDDREIREALVSALEDRNYTVRSRSSAQGALDFLRTGGRADVIILDLMMPGLDGWDFRAEQKKDPRIAAIPVISLSAAGALVDAPSLRKPVEIDDLIAAIEAARK
ncbi:MAG: response regulator [Myxococcales bacterium]|nr:response regulator [Myxococcales bacterium]